MREIIHDIVKHTGGLGFIEEVKVTGSNQSTLIEAMDGDRIVFAKGYLDQPIPALNGQFGIKSLALLNGLCGFASYKGDGTSLTVTHRQQNGVPVPEELQFRDAKGSGADFRLLNADHVAPQPKINPITWDIEFQPSKSKIQEFAQLASLYAAFEKWFGVKVVNDDLVFTIGDSGSASHRAKLVFQSEVGVPLNPKIDLYWRTSEVLSILKLAGNTPATMSISAAGMLRITIKSDHAKYDYFFPTRRK